MTPGRMFLVVMLAGVVAGHCSIVVSATDDAPLRIGLVRHYARAQSVTLSSQSGIGLQEPGGRPLLSCEPGVPVTISAEGGAITVRSGLDVRSVDGSFVTARPADPTGTVRVETPQCPPREYRGSIEVRPRAGTLLVINIVTVEEYLLGVVPAEMPSTYPIEALKAQAITARTFAVANRGKHARDGYDLCDTGNCQIYGGVSVEKPAAAEAVRATAGMIILYNGRPASVMYSSDCGGATQNPFETCPQRSLPYLCGVTEPADMPHTTWEAFVPLRDVESGLLRAGVKQAAGLASIRASKTDTSGRVTEFELTGSSGTAFVSGAKLRTALGAHVIKSLLLSVEQTTDGVVVFRGRGAGHGIGLCQVGAKWLASPPRNWTCDQILAHYFPGTQVAVPTRPADAASDSRNIGHAAETFPVTKRGREAKSSPSVLAKPDVRGGVDFDVRVDAPNGL